MGRIDDLVKQLCPDGVEYATLGDCSKIVRGERVTKKQLVANGTYPVISGGVTPMGFLDKFNRQGDTITIAQYGTAGYVDYQKTDFWANDVCYSVYPEEGLMNRFLWYALKNKQEYLYQIRNTDAIPYALPLEALKSVSIPLPPLSIQEQIVEVLDTFTDLLDNLEKELGLREKQMIYYRERLLSFEGEEVEYTTLGEVLDYEQPSKYLVKSTQYDDSYSTPVLTAGKGFLLGYTNEEDGIYQASKEAPTIIFDDFVTSFHWVDFPHKVKSSAIKFLRPKKSSEVSFRFVYYAMNEIRFVAKEHTRHWISVYSQFQIPLPSLARQQKIVEVLDTFTDLIDNIKQEIGLRQKQYEFYREKLLTFQPLKRAS